MNSILAPIRRRLSSNTSGVVEYEPDSPNEDGRRPTISSPMNLRTNSMMSPLIALPLDMVTQQELSRASSRQPSTYHLAPEYVDGRLHDPDYRPFPTMESLCAEMGIGYPLERWANGRREYIDDVGGYSGPVFHNPGLTTTVTEVRETRAQQMGRRVSNVGRQARRLSGGLVRSASKLFRLSSAQSVIRKKGRSEIEGSEDWQHVDLGREVEDESSLWPMSIEQDFRVVEWRAA